MTIKSAMSRVTTAIHATRARMSLRPLKRVSGAPDRSGLLFASLGTNASLRGVFMVALYHPEHIALCHPECVALCHPERSEGSIRGTTASLISVLMVASVILSVAKDLYAVQLHP